MNDMIGTVVGAFECGCVVDDAVTPPHPVHLLEFGSGSVVWGRLS